MPYGSRLKAFNVILVCCCSTLVFAQDQLQSSLLECLNITDDSQRLACYDRIASSQQPTVAQSQPVAPATVITQPSVEANADADSVVTDDVDALRQQQAILAEQRAALERERQAFEQQQQNLLSQQQQLEEKQQTFQGKQQEFEVLVTPSDADLLAAFGAEKLPESIRPLIPPDHELESITARVVSLRQAPNRRWIMVLDNGQVWIQTESKRMDFTSRDRNRDVQIERNSMNGYRLNQVATNRRIFVERFR